MIKQLEQKESAKLTEKEFSATSKKLRVWKFQKIIDEIIEQHWQNITILFCKRKKTFLVKQLKNWCTFEYGSYG